MLVDKGDIEINFLPSFDFRPSYPTLYHVSATESNSEELECAAARRKLKRFI